MAATMSASTKQWRLSDRRMTRYVASKMIYDRREDELTLDEVEHITI